MPPLYCYCTALHRLYIATGQEQYKKAAYDYYMKHYKDEDGPGVWDNFDWDSNSWAAVVLLQRCVFQAVLCGFLVFLLLFNWMLGFCCIQVGVWDNFDWD